MKSLSDYINEAADMRPGEEKKWDEFMKYLRSEIEDRNQKEAQDATDKDFKEIFGFDMSKLEHAKYLSHDSEKPLKMYRFRKKVIEDKWGTDWTVTIGCISSPEKHSNNIWWEVAVPKKTGPNKNCSLDCRTMYRIHGAGLTSGKTEYIGDDVKEFRKCFTELLNGHLYAKI